MKEGLLLKIIPKHLLEDMKKVINKKLVEVVNAPSQQVFHELLIETHDLVRFVLHLIYLYHCYVNKYIYFWSHDPLQPMISPHYTTTRCHVTLSYQ